MWGPSNEWWEKREAQARGFASVAEMEAAQEAAEAEAERPGRIRRADELEHDAELERNQAEYDERGDHQ